MLRRRDFFVFERELKGYFSTPLGYVFVVIFLIASGYLTVSRDPANGRITGTTLGGITTNRAYNAFGELEEIRVRVGVTDLFHVTYTRDDLGRITSLAETVGSVTTTKDYAYDLAGRGPRDPAVG